MGRDEQWPAGLPSNDEGGLTVAKHASRHPRVQQAGRHGLPEAQGAHEHLEQLQPQTGRVEIGGEFGKLVSLADTHCV